MEHEFFKRHKEKLEIKIHIFTCFFMYFLDYEQSKKGIDSTMISAFFCPFLVTIRQVSVNFSDFLVENCFCRKFYSGSTLLEIFFFFNCFPNIFELKNTANS